MTDERRPGTEAELSRDDALGVREPESPVRPSKRRVRVVVSRFGGSQQLLGAPAGLIEVHVHGFSFGRRCSRSRAPGVDGTAGGR